MTQPEPAQPRHTADDELWHLRLDKQGADLALAAAVRKAEEQRVRAELAEAKVAELNRAGDVALSAVRLMQQTEQRAERAEAALNAVRQLHVRNEHTGTCEECSRRDYPDYSVPAPCPTILALDAHNTSGESR